MDNEQKSVKEHNDNIDKLRSEKQEKKFARLEKEKSRKRHKKS